MNMITISEFAYSIPGANPTDYEIHISWTDVSVLPPNGIYIRGWLSGGKWEKVKKYQFEKG